MTATAKMVWRTESFDMVSPERQRGNKSSGMSWPVWIPLSVAEILSVCTTVLQIGQ
jgi:hypothetical protein